jgi:hypothetical protein
MLVLVSNINRWAIVCVLCDVGYMCHPENGCIICVCPGDELCRIWTCQPSVGMPFAPHTVRNGIWTMFPECHQTPYLASLPPAWPSISQTRGCTCSDWCSSVNHCCKWYLVQLGYSWWVLHDGCHNIYNLYTNTYFTWSPQSYVCTSCGYEFVTWRTCMFYI